MPFTTHLKGFTDQDLADYRDRLMLEIVAVAVEQELRKADPPDAPVESSAGAQLTL
jgi:hypothetical protein